MSTVTAIHYIESATSLLEKLDRIDAIILALETQALSGATHSDVESYKVDDGQIRIETEYYDAMSIAKAIEGYERMRQTILNKLNGRSVVLRPARGLS